MKKQNKTTKKTFDWHMQLHFIIGVSLFFFVMMGTTMFTMFAQLPENTNFSAYYFYIISSLLIPLLIFAVSYFIIPHRPTALEKAFWTLVVSFAAMLLYVTLQTFSWYIPFLYTYSDTENSWMMGEIYRTVVSLLPVVLYFGYLYYLRNKLIPVKKQK